jgi:hypothetical protein
MNIEKFNALLKCRIALMRSVLAAKSEEYSTEQDKLHNFKRAGQMLQCTPEKALIGMWTKHIISILDIVDKIEEYDKSHTPSVYNEVNIELIEEKIGDAVNYLILLEALLKERLE